MPSSFASYDIVDVSAAGETPGWDLISCMLTRCRDFRATYYLDGISVDTPNRLTAVKQHPSYLDGLSAFVQFLRGHKDVIPQLESRSSNWKPRVRITHVRHTWKGATFKSVPLSTLANSSNFSAIYTELPPELTIYAYQHPTRGYFLPSTEAIAFLQRCVDYGEFNFRMRFSSSGCSWDKRCYYTVTRVSPTSFQMLYREETKGTCGYHWRTAQINADFADGLLKFSLTQRKYGVANSAYVPVGTVYTEPSKYVAQSAIVIPNAPRTFRSWQLYRSGVFAISRLVPALYHTQSKALSRFLGEASSRLESFVELPEMLPILWELATAKVPKGVQQSGFIGIIAAAAKIAAGAYLAKTFAIDPAIKFVAEEIAGFTDDLNNIRGEGSYTIHGEAFSSLPQGLKDWLHTVSVNDPVSYSLTFRSLLGQKVDSYAVGDLILNFIKPLTTRKIVPSLATLYELQPYTFILDAYVPISDYIRFAEDRIIALGIRDTWIGFSVNIELTYSDGSHLYVFMRSNPSGVFLDPPLDSWYVSSGLSAKVAIPLLLVNLL